MKIYTKTGDAGETGLFGGGRVPKDDPRVEAYGDVDELNSAIGMARAMAPAQFHDALLESIQRDLFAIGGQLATPTRGSRRSRRAFGGTGRVMEVAIDAPSWNCRRPCLRPAGRHQGRRLPPGAHHLPARRAPRGVVPGRSA
jgi:hypothetical protein